MEKKKVAVFFGGASPEHDVSIVTGLQAFSAIDTSNYEPFPVYIDTTGTWLVGDFLLKHENFIPSDETKKMLTSVSLNISSQGKGILVEQSSSFFKKPKTFEFDIALLALHGGAGENGSIQGVFETYGVAYTGMRVMASSIAMDKMLTKKILSDSKIPTLPCTNIPKPSNRLLLNETELENICKNLTFPCCVKPRYLGSSIGVAKVENADELNSVLPNIFKYDSHAIVEPFVENMVEYNVSLRRDENNNILTSAIELPKCNDELLDFKNKYCSADGGKTGIKNSAPPSEGMLSLTREINPKINKDDEANIRSWATQAYNIIEGQGAPRIDFISNSKTGEIWLNEINSLPGSLGYFLWEAASESILFTELLSHLIEEGLSIHDATFSSSDPVPVDARIFKRM